MRSDAVAAPRSFGVGLAVFVVPPDVVCETNQFADFAVPDNVSGAVQILLYSAEAVVLNFTNQLGGGFDAIVLTHNHAPFCVIKVYLCPL